MRVSICFLAFESRWPLGILWILGILGIGGESSRKPRGPVVVLGSLCQALVARGRGGQRAMLSGHRYSGGDHQKCADDKKRFQ